MTEPLDLDAMKADAEHALSCGVVLYRHPKDQLRLIRMLKRCQEKHEEIKTRAEHAKHNVSVLTEQARGAFLVAWGSAASISTEALAYQGDPDA